MSTILKQKAQYCDNTLGNLPSRRPCFREAFLVLGLRVTSCFFRTSSPPRIMTTF